jgi:hypothetical protein
VEIYTGVVKGVSTVSVCVPSFITSSELLRRLLYWL